MGRDKAPSRDIGAQEVVQGPSHLSAFELERIGSAGDPILLSASRAKGRRLQRVDDTTRSRHRRHSVTLVDLPMATGAHAALHGVDHRRTTHENEN
jgi:hypothetical protein